MLPPIKVGRTGDTQLSLEEVRHPSRDPCPRDTEEGSSVVGGRTRSAIHGKELGLWFAGEDESHGC